MPTDYTKVVMEVKNARLFIERSIDSIDRNNIAVAVGHSIRAISTVAANVDALIAAIGPEAGEREEPHKCTQDCIHELERAVEEAEHRANVMASDLASVREQHAQTVAERDKLAKRVAELEAEGHVDSIDNFLREALVTLSGVVCTPEKGYLVDGGFRQLANDMREFREKYNDLVAAALQLFHRISDFQLEVANDSELIANFAWRWKKLRDCLPQTTEPA